MADRDLEPGGRRARGGCRRASGNGLGLLGLYDWCHLCTRAAGAYEPGVFDMSSGRPVGTTLTEVVQQLANGMSPWHPALQSPGWWRQDSRLTTPAPMDSLVDLGNTAFTGALHSQRAHGCSQDK
jgi:dTDP-4-dehydrorhamnose reductase